MLLLLHNWCYCYCIIHVTACHKYVFLYDCYARQELFLYVSVAVRRKNLYKYDKFWAVCMLIGVSIFLLHEFYNPYLHEFYYPFPLLINTPHNQLTTCAHPHAESPTHPYTQWLYPHHLCSTPLPLLKNIYKYQ